MASKQASSTHGTPDFVRLGLLLWLVVVVVSSFAPFEISLPQDRSDVAAEAMKLDLSLTGVRGALSHFAAFWFLGVLAASVHGTWLARHRGSLPLIALLGCGALETAQLFFLGRHARVADLALNFMGLLLGLWSAIHWHTGRDLRLALERFCTARALPMHAGLGLIAVSVWWGAGLRPALGWLQMDWDHNYPFMIGNELDGSRPWLGEIRYAGVYIGGMSAEQALQLYHNRLTDDAGATPRHPRLLAGYDFRQELEQTVMSHGVLQSEAMVLGIPAECEWRDSVGLILAEPSLLRTRGTASELNEAVTASGAFTVEAWIQPLNQTQSGPARILSVSTNTSNRNFTLGQTGTGVTFRVRNLATGVNGARHAFHASDVLGDDAPQHLVALYDHGVSMLYLNGHPHKHVVDLREPAVHLGLGTRAGGRAASAVLIVLAVTLPVFAVISSLGLVSHLAAITLSFGAAVAPYMFSCLWVGGPWRAEMPAWLMAGLFVIYPLAMRYASPVVHNQWTAHGVFASRKTNKDSSA